MKIKEAPGVMEQAARAAWEHAEVLFAEGAPLPTPEGAGWELVAVVPSQTSPFQLRAFFKRIAVNYERRNSTTV